MEKAMDYKYHAQALDDKTQAQGLEEKVKFGKRKAGNSPTALKNQTSSKEPHDNESYLGSSKRYRDKLLIVPESSTFLKVGQQCTFSHDLFKNLVVLRQVDRKFISCLVEENGNKLVILIDQHAAHERVCLEKLIQIHSDKDEKDELRIRSSAINPHLKLSFTSHEVETLRKSVEHCQRLGLKLFIESSVDIIVTRVPTCFLERESNEVKRGRSSVYQQLTESLISECVRELEEKGTLNLRLLPHTVRNILNSLACHGAVKFGDELSKNQCVQLMRALGQCQTPFQCAHGRPVLTPLLQLADLEKLPEPKVNLRPRYERLKESRSPTTTT